MLVDVSAVVDKVCLEYCSEEKELWRVFSTRLMEESWETFAKVGRGDGWGAVARWALPQR